MFLCLALVSVITIVTALLTDDLLYAAILGTMGALFTMFTLDLWKSKILVDTWGVRRKSALIPRKIAWSEIKSFGIYQQVGKYTSLQISVDIADSETFDTIFIALSKLPDYNPNSFRKSAAMRFHYHSELYNIIFKQINDYHK